LRILEKRHAGKSKTVAYRRHVNGEGDVRDLARLERGERNACADGARFLKGKKN
jgi:hypothetical protein